MTLYRQIIISIILLFVLGFLGTVIISTGNLRAFLVTQMESHAQDTATSLGLSLSRPVQANDMAVINSMVDVIYDRGYYLAIEVTSADGSTLVSRNRPDVVHDIPDWFADLVDLQTPTVEAMVMSGWKQAATVYVTSHPGNAYRELWSNTTNTFWLFLITAALILTGGLLAVHILLQPLREVEKQANAICNRTYPVQEKLPRTRELRQVVMAMNRLSKKVNEIFSEQSVLTEHLREQAFKDPVTGLGNRRYFDRQLQNLVESHENSSQGALFILEIKGLAQTNRSSGFAHGDELLKQTADILENALGNIDNCFISRISGSGFGIVTVGIDQQEAASLADQMCHELLQLRAEKLAKPGDNAHIGIAIWKPGDTAPGLLSEADAALRAAQMNGQKTWQGAGTVSTVHNEIHGREDWHRLLQQTIDSGNVYLEVQPVYSLDRADHKLMHKEVLLRLHDQNGQPVSAGVFMPMAERKGLASALDRLAFGKLLDFMAGEEDKTTTYAVNLSSCSLHDPVFVQWLCSRLHSHCTNTGS